MSAMMLAGRNFSGRTARLRAWCGLDGAAATARAAYLGPDPLTGLSGLAPTVRGEIELAAADEPAARSSISLVEELGFDYILPRNPFALSGGEQVVAAVASALALRPERLAIDCALEQLAAEVRDALVGRLETVDTEVRLADNRQSEWHAGAVETLPDARDPPTVDVPDDLLAPPGHVTVEVRDLHFAYPDGTAVFEGLSARLAGGTAYRLAGANGSGKSTFSRLLCGLLRPQRGEIRVDGRVVRPWRGPGGLASYHFQNPTLQVFARTVGQQLARAANPRAVAEGFGVGAPPETHPLDLPYVLRKRLALATAFAAPAPLLILDEPTLGQDDAAARGVRTAALRRAGLIVSHSKVYEDLPTIAF